MLDLVDTGAVVDESTKAVPAMLYAEILRVLQIAVMDVEKQQDDPEAVYVARNEKMLLTP